MECEGTSVPFDVEVFYDGACPLCVREVGVLRRLDRGSHLKFTDIAAAAFEAASYGKVRDDFMKRMQARLSDGSWVEGVEAFRRIYGALGFRWVTALSRAPGLSCLLDRAYDLFARNRLRLTGRCEGGACDVPERS